VDDIGFRPEPGEPSRLIDQLLVQIQRGPHMQTIMHI
jgi:hypothetical protein